MKNCTVDSISIRGFSHIKSDKECQDSSGFIFEHDYSAIFVCDGHGGEKYIRSSHGSKTAVEVGKEMIAEFMEKAELSEYNFDSVLSHLEAAIIQEWNNRISVHYNNNPIDTDFRFAELNEITKKSLLEMPIKAYGTTFIAAVVTEKYYFIIKLGDGDACVITENGAITMPESLEDENLQFNLTTSMCNGDADKSFRHCFQMKPVIGVVLSSDGVINCYNNKEAFKSLIGNIYCSYGEEDADTAHVELCNCLNLLSEKGSGDDLSVSIIGKYDSDFKNIYFVNKKNAIR